MGGVQFKGVFQRIDPLVVFASLQGLLGVGVICALTALGAGSVVLGLTIVWPKRMWPR